MVRRERIFYSEAFKEHVLTAYYNSNESVSAIANRFDVSKDTVSSRVYRKRVAEKSRKSVKLAPLKSTEMKDEELYSEEKYLCIKGLEHSLSTEKMRSESLEKMIEIAERELKIEIRKKFGAKQSMEMKQEHPSCRTEALCQLFGRSRQAYCERSHYVAIQIVEEAVILSPVREVRRDFPRMRAGKLPVFLQPQFEAKPVRIDRDAFIELPYRNFLLVRRYRNKRRTTFSSHWMHKYPNLTGGYIPSAPNRLRVSDITYIETGDKVAYLSLITDACSHKVVSRNLSLSLRTSGAPGALKMALYYDRL